MESIKCVVPEVYGEMNLPAPDEQLLHKFEELKSYLKSLKKIAVGFSSGVDSTFLLQAAIDSGVTVIAITATSHSFPTRELEEAKAFCEKVKVEQYIVEADELSIPGFRENRPDRCYVCKMDLFGRILNVAKEQGMLYVTEASNLDDNGDYRPGLEAVKELGILSPLRKIGFTKQEIRILSKHLGLPTAKKPSFACLASRFPYGEFISAEKLDMVDKGETILMQLGFHQFRVRIHDKLARIELKPEEFQYFMQDEVRELVYREFKKIGFQYVSLDLAGYRTGSLNEALPKDVLEKGLHN